jgi:serine phosphatase RsbU (regulator of sigma subunit)
MGFMTIADDEQSYWLSCSGVDLASDTDRVNAVEDSFCQYVIADRAPFVVDDAAANARTKDNPSVSRLGVRAWAGYPVLDAAGQALGSFCVVDTVPRVWSPEQVAMLGTLAAAASAQVQLLAALVAERRADERLKRLAKVASQLGSAVSLEDLTEVVNEALPVLGADGAAVVVLQDDGSMRLGIGDRLGEQTKLSYAHLPADDPLPACHVARTGQPLQLPTQRSGVEFTPQMAAVYETTGRYAWAFTPLVVDGTCLGSLAVSWPDERTFEPGELDLIDAFAAQCAQALQRILAAEARQDEARQVAQLAHSLQQALLTPPPEPDHLHLVVRYRPATHTAQVGGDWYDAFLQPDGATMLVIGDVVGHDSTAAAKMGQLRGVLRALAYTAEDSRTPDTPAGVLSRVERTVRGLEVEALATAVLARVERIPDDPLTGRRVLRWSNAGHLAPVLLLADGSSTVLNRPADLLLGVDPGTERHDHTEDLPDGSTLLMFTDGLVERRGEDLDRGVARLQDALRDLGRVALDELCDVVLDRLGADAGEDDIAMLAVRAYTEQQPRPAEAGPQHLPPGVT